MENIDFSEFFIPHVDQSGEGKTVSAIVPRRYKELLAIAAKQRSLPYRSEGDVLRHALHRHFDWLSKRNVKLAPPLVEELIFDYISVAPVELCFQSVADRLLSHIMWCVRAGDLALAYGIYERFKLRIMSGFNSPNRNKDRIAELDQRWEHILRLGILISPDQVFKTKKHT